RAKRCGGMGIECRGAGIAELTRSCTDGAAAGGGAPAADCTTSDPQAAPPTAPNAPGKPPVCIAGPPGSAHPPAFASALFGRASQCQGDGSVTVTRDGDTRRPEATGVAEFTGAPCPREQVACGGSFQPDPVH